MNKLIYNDDVFEIEALVEDLSEKINQSELIETYCESFAQINQNSDVALLKKEFQSAKQSFETIEAYGKYAPDFKEKRRALRKAKRSLDTNELIGEYKYKETSVQTMMDYMTFDIAKSISDEIKIDAGNPFFEFAKRGCGGSCHVG